MTLTQWVTERFHSHYGKHFTPVKHELNVVLDVAEGYAQYKTIHQRNVIRQQSMKIKMMEEAIKEAIEWESYSHIENSVLDKLKEAIL